MFTTRSRTTSRALFQAVLVVALVAVGFVASPGQLAAAAGAANDHTVLILGSSVSGGASSPEAIAATGMGMDVEIASDAAWAAKTTADFATYRALILGDPTCRTSLSSVAAAQANTATWGPAVNGRIVIMGSDPVFHSKTAVTTGIVQFVAGEATKTGAYVSLSCYYHFASAHTAVPLLDAFAVGGFTTTGVGGYNDVHIVASSPALAGLTDAALSNWGNSVHEAFDSWPVATFDVLAIARDIGTSYTAPDGSVGTPYILARGVTVISDIALTPGSGTATLGSSYTLTATITEDEAPQSGYTVTFEAIAGPNVGRTITGGPTNASGQATATYSSSVVGTDTWVARFMDSHERTQTSGRATVTWAGGKAEPTVAPRLATISARSASCGQIAVSAMNLTAGLGYQIVVTASAGGSEHVVNVTADAAGLAGVSVDTQSAFGTTGGTFSAFVRLVSTGTRYSNTATVTVTACPVATPTPAPTPSPTAAPTVLVPSTIGRLPSTATGDGDAGTTAILVLGLLALGAIVWKRGLSRT